MNLPSEFLASNEFTLLDMHYGFILLKLDPIFKDNNENQYASIFFQGDDANQIEDEAQKMIDKKSSNEIINYNFQQYFDSLTPDIFDKSYYESLNISIPLNNKKIKIK